MQTYFIKDKEYHLHYTIGRMEQLEKILGNASGNRSYGSTYCKVFCWNIQPIISRS